MIVRKLRLRRGWSQDQLAELSDLSVRTIQRIERGHKPSLESCKALASVFEVDISTFLPEEDTTMETVNQSKLDPVKEGIQDDERDALAYAKSVKDFAQGLFAYLVIAVVFIFKWGFEPKLLAILGALAIFFALYALFVFEVIRLPFHDFEKRLAEKRLGRKL